MSSLIVTKNIKELFKKRDIKTSQQAIEAINKEVEKLCFKAADHVRADKLKIVKASHIPSLDPLLESANQG